MNDEKWVFCPVCKGKTRVQIRDDTELKNFPLFCPKCKQKTLISVKENKITIIQCQSQCCSADNL